MNVYCLLAKVEETPTEIGVKQEMPDEHADLLKAKATNPKAQIALQDQNNDTRALKGTKIKKLTFTGPNMTDEEFNNTWDYYYRSFNPQINLFHSNKSRMKLVGDESPYIPQAPTLAKLIHLAIPRFDLFFQKVDNRISYSNEYIYVSIYSLI